MITDFQKFYEHCNLCPNHCNVNRLANERGRCNESSTIRVAWSGLHKGEEPPITGENGSGMIFFSGCPLHCAYCQNYQISGSSEHGEIAVGIELSVQELAEMMLSLQQMGATNLNLVTGTHFIPSIAAALDIARDKGFFLDVVYNSSGFESELGLSILDPYIDLYLVDVKTLDEEVSKTFCGLALYAKCIKAVMQYLIRKKKRTYLTESNQLKGILVRHLVFPGTIAATRQVLEYFAEELKACCYLSLMVQFENPRGDMRSKPVSVAEYDSLLQLLDELSIEDGFVQELGENVSWIPDFTQDNPFPENFAAPLPYFLALKEKLSR
ncbi:MAG: radical SAM protein [Spirochaetia bacterium]|nr:radical SAM protein [Spirochaetia bacterium]